MKTRVEIKHESPAQNADERAAEAAQQRFTNLLNSIESIVWEAEPSTFKFSLVICHAGRILGYPIEMWLGEPTFWKRIIRPDGVQRVIRCVGTAVLEKKVVTRFVGILMDITGRFNSVV